jgi:hypothetical protein
MVKIQPKVRFGFSAGDFEWDLRAGTVLVKERVDRLQQDGLPTSGHLGELGIQSEQSMKVEQVSVKAVLAVQIRIRAWDVEMQVRELEDPVPQIKRSRQLRRNYDFGGVPDQFWLAQAAKAKRVNTSLEFFIAELSFRNMEMAG